ncbi:MAG TPA: hypothetical protein VND64_29320 [Pirellulales bacterium]|nr:hypothetical protein [Pirellulales bacterium]
MIQLAFWLAHVPGTVLPTVIGHAHQHPAPAGRKQGWASRWFQLATAGLGSLRLPLAQRADGLGREQLGSRRWAPTGQTGVAGAAAMGSDMI